MTRNQGAMICAVLVFFAVHLLAADIVGLYLFSQIGDDKSNVVVDDVTPSITDGKTSKCDPEGDVCP